MFDPEKPSLFRRIESTPCLRNTLLWSLGCFSLGFLHRFVSGRRLSSAVQTGMFAGNMAAAAYWVTCRANFRTTHSRYVELMEMRRAAGENLERSSHATFRLDDGEEPPL